jgi:amino acid transporter
MGSKFISNAGPIEFIIRGVGDNAITGTLALLMWMSYVISISLFASAFAGYFLALVGLEQSRLLMGIVEVVVISTFTALNFFGSKAVGRAESLIVLVKLVVLGIFILGGIWTISPKMVAPEISPEGIMSAVYAATIFFLTYTGFGLVTNASENIENPERNVPRAIYLSLIIVTAVYVMIAVVTVGNLPYDVIIKARDYALAVAAKPSLGEAGFWLITFAALASTSSAINATLYGTARASYMVAKYGQLPEAVEKPLWKQAYEGLLIISIISLILANTASLESISIAGSGGFLLIFLFVNIAALKLRDRVKLNPTIPAIGTVLTFTALVILIYRMVETDARDLMIFASLIVASFLIEASYRAITGRKIEEYLDVRLRKRVENLNNWHKWIDGVISSIVDAFEDAEVYLVGSIARGDIKKAHDVDLLVLTNNPPAKDMEKHIARELKQKAKLTPHHSVDIHFADKQRKNEALRRAKHYKLLKRS